MSTLTFRDIDGWSYCVEHDEFVGDGDLYADDDGEDSCRAWLAPLPDQGPCRFVPVVALVIGKRG